MGGTGEVLSDKAKKKITKATSYAGLIAIILSIYSLEVSEAHTKKEEQQPSVPKQKSKSTRDIKDPLLNIPIWMINALAVGIITVVNLVELGVAKDDLDEILQQDGQRHPVAKEAAESLVASRLSSVAASGFLINSKHLARLTDMLEGPFVPGVTGAIVPPDITTNL